MKKKIYNKLITDKIPGIIKKSGSIPEITILDEADFRKALKVKMTEEAQELLEAESTDDVLNELADVEELVRAIAKNYSISLRELEEHRKAKLHERGGFKKKLFLSVVRSSDEPDY